MELPEILIDWEIVGNDIKLTFFDKKISIQSIETGKIKFISNWLKIKNNNSITELSIDEMIKNMRGQVK